MLHSSPRVRVRVKVRVRVRVRVRVKVRVRVGVRVRFRVRAWLPVLYSSPHPFSIHANEAPQAILVILPRPLRDSTWTGIKLIKQDSNIRYL